MCVCFPVFSLIFKDFHRYLQVFLDILACMKEKAGIREKCMVHMLYMLYMLYAVYAVYAAYAV